MTPEIAKKPQPEELDLDTSALDYNPQDDNPQRDEDENGDKTPNYLQIATEANELDKKQKNEIIEKINEPYEEIRRNKIERNARIQDIKDRGKNVSNTFKKMRKEKLKNKYRTRLDESKKKREEQEKGENNEILIKTKKSFNLETPKKELGSITDLIKIGEKLLKSRDKDEIKKWADEQSKTGYPLYDSQVVQILQKLGENEKANEILGFEGDKKNTNTDPELQQIIEDFLNEENNTPTKKELSQTLSEGQQLADDAEMDFASTYTTEDNDQSSPEFNKNMERIGKINTKLEELKPFVESIKIGLFKKLKINEEGYIKNLPENNENIVLERLAQQKEKLGKKGKIAEANQKVEQINALEEYTNLLVERDKLMVN